MPSTSITALSLALAAAAAIHSVGATISVTFPVASSSCTGGQRAFKLLAAFLAVELWVDTRSELTLDNSLRTLQMADRRQRTAGGGSSDLESTTLLKRARCSLPPILV